MGLCQSRPCDVTRTHRRRNSKISVETITTESVRVSESIEEKGTTVALDGNIQKYTSDEKPTHEHRGTPRGSVVSVKISNQRAELTELMQALEDELQDDSNNKKVSIPSSGSKFVKSPGITYDDEEIEWQPTEEDEFACFSPPATARILRCGRPENVLKHSENENNKTVPKTLVEDIENENKKNIPNISKEIKFEVLDQRKPNPVSPFHENTKEILVTSPPVLSTPNTPQQKLITPELALLRKPNNSNFEICKSSDSGIQDTTITKEKILNNSIHNLQLPPVLHLLREKTSDLKLVKNNSISDDIVQNVKSNEDIHIYSPCVHDIDDTVTSDDDINNSIFSEPDLNFLVVEVGDSENADELFGRSMKDPCALSNKYSSNEESNKDDLFEKRRLSRVFHH